MAVPRWGMFTLQPAVFRAAVQFRLGMELEALQGVGTCAACGAQVDPMGLHYMTHSAHGAFVWRHDRLRDVWADLLQTFCSSDALRVEDLEHWDYSPVRPDITIFDWL